MKPAQLFALLRLLCLAVLMAGALPAHAQSTCQARAFNGHEEQVSAAYIAYYGRPADTGGLAYWAGKLAAEGGRLDAIIDAFGNSTEYRQRFGGLSNRELIRNLYQQLYGRDPDEAGWAFYEMWLDTKVLSLASIAISIMDGTEGSDAAILDNRKTVARHFITRMEALGAAAPAITDGSLLADLMAATDGDSASAAAACERMDELINTSTPGTGDDVIPAIAQVALFPDKPYYSLGEAISWQIEAAYQNQHIDWHIDGTVVQATTWRAAGTGTYRLRGNVKNAQGAVIAYASANIVVAGLKPLLTVGSGATLASGLAVSSGTQLDGLSVQVPALAVAAGTQISAFAVDADPVPFTGLQPVSPVIEMQPVGTQFAQPVQIRIPFDLSSLAMGEQLWVTRYSGGEIDHLSPTYLDHEANEVVFETDHFSFFKLEKGMIFEKTKSEKFLLWVKDLMKGFCANDNSGVQRCWDGKISDEALSRALNTFDGSKHATTPYDFLEVYYFAEKAKNARGRNAAEEGAAISEFIGGPVQNMDSLVNGGKKAFEKLADRFGFAHTAAFPLLILEQGYEVYKIGTSTFDNACLRKSADVLADWRAKYPYRTLKELVQSPDLGHKEPGYWPNAIGCASLPRRVNMNDVSLDDAVNYLSSVMLYLEMVDFYRNANVQNVKKGLLFAAQNYNLHTQMSFEYTPASGPYAGLKQTVDLSRENDYDGAIVRLGEGAKFITIRPKPSLVPSTDIPVRTKSVSILGADGTTRLSTGQVHAQYVVKPGLNIIKVETLAYWTERTQNNSFKENELKSVKSYKIFVPNSKKAYTATSAELGTANLSRNGSKIKLQVKPAFQPAAAQLLADAQQPISAATQSQGQESYVKAAYAINIQCGAYKVQAGQDGMLNVDASLLNSGSLSNCTAHVTGTEGEQDEDEILASTFAINLGSALSVATASTLPTDRAVVGIGAVNGRAVDKPLQERDINAGDTVDFGYYVPQGATILASDPDGSGRYGSFQGVAVSGKPGFYTQRIHYPQDAQGTRRPSIKVRINGVEKTASAPELLVKPASPSSPLPTVRISPQSAQVAVGAMVTLTATISGEYSTIIWQKLQGPGTPKVTGTLVTPQLQVRLPVAGTYVLAAKVCNGGSLCTIQSVTIQAGTVPDNPQPDGGGLIAGRYLPIEGGSVIRDTVNKLEWQRCLVGQTWNDASQSCDGNAQQYNWYDAIQLTAAGGFGIPTIAELKTLAYCSSGQPQQFGPLPDYHGCIGRNGEFIVEKAFPISDQIKFNFIVWSNSEYNLLNVWVLAEEASTTSGKKFSDGVGWYVRLVRVALSSATWFAHADMSTPVSTASTTDKAPSATSPVSLAALLASVTGPSGTAPDAPLLGARLDSGTHHAYFLSRATNLLPGAVDGVQHLYGFDPASRALWRVSQAPSGEAADADTMAFDLAAQAGKLVFSTRASNLEGGPGLYLVDLETGTRRPLLTALQHGGSDPGADNPVLGTTGQGLAFDAPDAAGRLQVFTAGLGESGLHDLRQETPIDGQSIEACCAALSGDGRYLAWQEVGHDGRVLARVLDLASDKSVTIDWPQEAATGQVLRLALSENGAQLYWLALPDTAENAAPLHGVANPLFVPTQRLH